LDARVSSFTPINTTHFSNRACFRVVRSCLTGAIWAEALKTSPLRQLTVIYLDFSYKRQQTKTPRQLSQLVNDDGCVPTVTGWCSHWRRRDRCSAQSWPAREHPTGSIGDARRRCRPRKSGAGRVAPTVAAAPAQAAVQLWTLGAKSLTRSEAGTPAQPQRYGA
jgi:hypothetical protein